MKTFTHTDEQGNKNEVELANWAWLAIYKDGSFLKQYEDSDMSFHQFKEIDLDNLDVFVVYNTQDPNNPEKRYEVHIEEGMTPIFFTRVSVFNMKQHNETKVKMVHFGYKQIIGGKVAKTILAIHPTGALAIKNTDGRENLD